MILEYQKLDYPSPWVDVPLAFPKEFADDILKHFPQENPVGDYDGTRSSNNSFRMFVNRYTNKELTVMFEPWDTVESRLFFTQLTGVDCSDGLLRIELCQDYSGFYLHKHIDIPEKYITLQIYLGDGDESWGTSIYDNSKLYKTNSFKHNSGWLSYRDSALIHGIEKNTITGIRRSIIINYVIPTWRDTDQLYCK